MVFLVHLQRCFVRTSMPLALGDRAVVEKAERKCQGSFSKAIISVYIFVWLREMKPLVKRKGPENITSQDVTVTKTLSTILWNLAQGACSGMTLWVSHPMR